MLKTLLKPVRAGEDRRRGKRRETGAVLKKHRPKKSVTSYTNVLVHIHSKPPAPSCPSSPARPVLVNSWFGAGLRAVTPGSLWSHRLPAEPLSSGSRQVMLMVMFPTFVFPSLRVCWATVVPVSPSPSLRLPPPPSMTCAMGTPSHIYSHRKTCITQTLVFPQNEKQDTHTGVLPEVLCFVRDIGGISIINVTISANAECVL